MATGSKRSNRTATPSPCQGTCGPARFSPTWARKFRHRTRFTHDAIAVTPVVGTLIILAISSIGIAAVLTWGLPNIQQAQAVTELKGIESQFMATDQIIETVMRGGADGKASAASLNIPKGSIQRENGTLFQVTWHPNQTTTDDRFFLLDMHDADKQRFRVAANDTSGTNDRYVLVERVNGTTTTPVTDLTPATGWTNGAITVNLGTTALEAEATRVRVMEIATGDDLTIMETWILPSGSIRYERMTSFGIAGYRVEHSGVIAESEQGDFLVNTPLGNREELSDGTTTFIGLFSVRLIDNITAPGVQAAGAGSYPILFSLGGNNLRANGLAVEALQIDAIGVRAGLWEDHYRTTFQMASITDTPLTTSAGEVPRGVYLQGKEVGAQPIRAFDFVLLESRVEASLRVDATDLGAGV